MMEYWNIGKSSQSSDDNADNSFLPLFHYSVFDPIIPSFQYSSIPSFHYSGLSYLRMPLLELSRKERSISSCGEEGIFSLACLMPSGNWRLSRQMI